MLTDSVMSCCSSSPNNQACFPLQKALYRLKNMLVSIYIASSSYYYITLKYNSSKFVRLRPAND